MKKSRPPTHQFVRYRRNGEQQTKERESRFVAFLRCDDAFICCLRSTHGSDLGCIEILLTLFFDAEGMNFVNCGADPCQVYEGISVTSTTRPQTSSVRLPSKRSSSLPSDFEICHQRVVFNREDDEDSDDESTILSSTSVTNGVHTVSTALDNIQQTLDERKRHFYSINSEMNTSAPATPPRCKPDSPDRAAASMLACSPSPNMLNPLSMKDCSPCWRRGSNGLSSPQIPTLFCSSAPYGLEILTRRMAEGYDVRITNAPCRCLGPNSLASLYLSEDRHKLYLAPRGEPKTDEKKEENGWVEIHARTIRRIDQGRGMVKSTSTCAFSLVVEHATKNDVCEYYDLEATSAIDREVIVTTILLILDKEFEGTMDQPIPCSPSLEPDPSNMFSEPGKSLSMSESLDEFGEMPIGASTTEKSINSSRDNNNNSSNNNNSNSNTGERHHHRESNSNETSSFLQFAPSASSLNLAAANSATAQHQYPGTWCAAADTCTFALHDITDTCAGIFELKQSQCLAPQQILVEEFISTALGAPHAFYNCFSHGGYWEQEEINADSATKSAMNRASRLHAQAARLRSLRNEMSFAAALKQSKSKMMQSLRTVKSYDSSAMQRRKATDQAVSRIHNSALLDSLVGKMAVYDDNGDSKEPGGGSLYYDSDPEDYRTQTRRPRAVPAPPSESFEERSMLNGIDLAGHQRKLSRKLDDDTIREITQVGYKSFGPCLIRY
jgi:hypothetical protein